MDREQRRCIEQDCRDLIIRLVHHYDHGEAEKAAALFVPDGVWVKSRVRYRGHGEIVASFTNSDLVLRHFTSNILVDVEDERTASAVTYYLAFIGRRASDRDDVPLELPGSMGEWRDTFLLTDEGWRIVRHEGSRVFSRP